MTTDPHPSRSSPARRDRVAPGRPSSIDLRRLLLLALVLFLLATAVPGSAGTGKPPRRDPQLQDAGPPPFTGTCVDGTRQKFPCSPGR